MAKFAVINAGKATAFYSTDIHESIPPQAVAITDNNWFKYISNQPNCYFDANLDVVVTAPTVETPDEKADQATKIIDRLQFEVLFLHENRVRALEGKAPITRLQFKNALITIWKAINP